jgi:hypothetical protein
MGDPIEQYLEQHKPNLDAKLREIYREQGRVAAVGYFKEVMRTSTSTSVAIVDRICRDIVPMQEDPLKLVVIRNNFK